MKHIVYSLEQETVKTKLGVELVGIIHKIVVAGNNSKIIAETIGKCFDYMKYYGDNSNSWSRSKHIILQLDETPYDSISEVEHHIQLSKHNNDKFIRFGNSSDTDDNSFSVIFPCYFIHKDMANLVSRAMYDLDSDLNIPHIPISAGFFSGNYYGMSESMSVNSNSNDIKFMPDVESFKVQILQSLLKLPK